ncbi:hypothetical protein [Micromonospora haikouensis]|uniref:hypothetical protein n=1 Tax=Micromonospora haikouensis TaxID=686309 RepID=UPI00159F0CA1|nr:hypothetical protein [Micromonospora haikouensis]
MTHWLLSSARCRLLDGALDLALGVLPIGRGILTLLAKREGGFYDQVSIDHVPLL